MKRGKPLSRRAPLRSRANGIAPVERESGPAASAVVLPWPPNYPRRAAGISPASRDQRAKAKEGCRVHGNACGGADPAHVVDRSIGGCDHEDCTVPLCRALHREYDEGRFDLLPYLSPAEQAHAAGHLGLLRALRRVTGHRWTPELGPEVRY